MYMSSFRGLRFSSARSGAALVTLSETGPPAPVPEETSNISASMVPVHSVPW
jgi:hypothetical protein